MHDIFENTDTSGTPSVILMSELNIVNFKIVCYMEKIPKLNIKF